MNRFLATCVERFDSALPLIAAASAHEADGYLEWSAADGNVRQVDDAFKWAELLQHYGVLPQSRVELRIRSLQDRLAAIVPPRPRATYGADRSACGILQDGAARVQRRPIVLLASALSKKVHACVQVLRQFGVEEDDVQVYFCAQPVGAAKPYRTAAGPWYEPGVAEPQPGAGPSGIAFEPISNYWELLPRVRARPSVLLVFGAPVLPVAFLDSYPGPIVNGHNGPLPQIRGLDAPGWCRLSGLAFSCTVHRIAREIDGGTLLARRTLADGTKRSFDAAIAEEMAASALLLASEDPGAPAGEIEISGAGYHTTMSMHTRQVLDQVSPTANV